MGLYRGERRIAGAKVGEGGRFSLRGRVGTPDAVYTVRYGGAVSNPVALAVRPGLDTAFVGSGEIGRPLALTVRERPATAGPITVRVWRAERLVAKRTGSERLRVRLSSRRATTYRVLVSVTPAQGYTPARRALQQTVFVPALRLGSRVGREDRSGQARRSVTSIPLPSGTGWLCALGWDRAFWT